MQGRVTKKVVGCIVILQKRVGGQITVYAAISILLVIALICTCVRSASMSFMRAGIDAACRISTEAVFSGYANPVLDEFDVLLLKRTDGIDAKLKKYVEENINNLAMGEGIQCETVAFDEFSMVTDEGGENFKREVLAYMDYGKYTELIQNISSMEREQERVQAINEVTNEVVKCEDQILALDETVLELVSLVEGIKTDQTGIVITNGMPVAVEGDFAKAVIHEKVSMGSIAVSNDAVYLALTEDDNRYCNIDEVLENILLSVKQQNEEGKQTNYAKFKQVTKGVSQKIEQALVKISAYEGARAQAEISLAKCKTMVENKRGEIGETLTEMFMSDFLGEDCKTEMAQHSLCNIDYIKEALNSNLCILEEAQELLGLFENRLTLENVEFMEKQVLKCKNIVSGISNEKLRFDYTGIDFSGKAEGIGSIKKLYQQLTQGVASLVLDGREISDKKISYSEMATQLANVNQSVHITEKMQDNIIYNEYLFIKFNSYTDYVGKENSLKLDTGKLLDYMVEYILCGNNSDSENISSIITKLSLVREGVNMAYLMTDNSKKNEAFVVATELVGFTGNMAVIKAAQYLIMAAWAYGESVVELKQLYQGGKIPVIKNTSNWQLSLENMLKMKFFADNDEQEKGMSYEDCLRLLLLIEKTEQKYYRTMGAVEVRMMELGYQEFRMKNYICSATATVKLRIKTLGQSYIRNVQYSYI